MTLSAGNVVAKIDENGNKIETEMSREYKVLYVSGYEKVKIVVLEDVK